MSIQQTNPVMQKMIDSPKMQSEIREVGAAFSLNIDQTGELYAEVRDILKGITKSSDFVSHIINRLEIDRSTAEKIAVKLNDGLFKIIKLSYQTESSAIPSSQTDLERIGGFSIEQEQESNSIDQSNQNIESHDEVISNIENPVPAQPSRPNTETEHDHTETMLVDHLLSGSVVTVEKKVESQSQIKPILDNDPVPQKPKKPRGPDLYREPIA